MAETTSRALELLSLLQTHRQWPGTELADRLGVTARTLRRDIERLRELGYRIEAARGAAGGYRLEAGARLPPLLLGDEEAVTMAIGLRVAATLGLVDGEQTAQSALAKFEQVLPSALRERVNALGAFVSQQAPGGDLVAPALLGQLALACRDTERIRFHYVAADGAATDRTVEPFSLVASGRRWFLVCWDLQREDWRTFRVDRINRFFGTRVRFAPRPLPAEDAAAFVATAVAGGHRRYMGEVILRIPVETLREDLGSWATEAVAIDASSTRWPIGGDSMAVMLSALAWIPEGVEYELRGSAEFLAVARNASERMRRAVTACGTG
ncbi:MAG TPA: WYL domain-containing protein [Microbacteriaceae bacterium]